LVAIFCFLRDQSPPKIKEEMEKPIYRKIHDVIKFVFTFFTAPQTVHSLEMTFHVVSETMAATADVYVRDVPVNPTSGYNKCLLTSLVLFWINHKL